MADSDCGGVGGTPSRAPASGCSASEVIGRLQRLADTPPPAGGHSLEWAVEAHYLGDATALAALSLRSTTD
jgi:hypothetical protein